MRHITHEDSVVLDGILDELHQEFRKDKLYLKSLFFGLAHQSDAETKTRMDALVEKHRKLNSKPK